MAAISATTPQTVTTQSQTRIDSSNPQFRENKNIREKLDLTKPSGTSAARTQATETKNYKEAQQLLASETKTTNESATPVGQRRGSVLDLSV
jgi:hypothetical protein